MHRIRMAVGIVLLLVLGSTGIAAGDPREIQADAPGSLGLHRLSSPQPMGAPIEQIAPGGAEPALPPPFANDLHPEWTEFAPPRREQHALLYDARRDRFIVIGQRADALWEFRTRPHEEWTRLPASGHAPEVCLASVLDPVANRVIVLGTDAAGQHGFWELRLVGRAVWKSLRGAPELLPYPGTAIAFDPNGERILIVQDDEVWVVTLGSDAPGHQIATIPFIDFVPFAPSAVFDAQRNHLLLADGSGRLYRLDLAGAPEWLETSEQLWLGGYLESTRLLLDSAHDEAIVVHGRGSIIALSLSSGSTRVLAGEYTLPLAPRWRYAAAIDPSAGEILIHGGQVQCQVVVSDMHAWNMAGAAWRTVGPSVGAHRERHLAVVDPFRDRLLLYFGGERFENSIGNLQILDLTHPDAGMTELLAAPESATNWTPGWFGSLFFDTRRDLAFILGTETSTESVGLYRTTTHGAPTWQRHELAGGGPNPFIVLFHDEPGDRLVVARYEYTLVPTTIDLWALSLATLTWRRLDYSGPLVPLSLGKAVYDAKRRCAWFAWRGDSLYQVRLDADRVNVTAFAIENGRTTFPFSARIYDETRSRILGFSHPHASGFGLSYEFHDELIALEVGPRPRWVRYQTMGPHPSPRGNHAFALDRKRDRLIIHGGYDDECLYFTESYALSLPGLAPERRPMRAADADPAPIAEEALATHRVGDLQASFPAGTSQGALEIRFTLRPGDDGRIDLIDLQGRRIVTRDIRTDASGQGRTTITEAASIQPGVYFVRLRHGALQNTLKVAVVR